MSFNLLFLLKNTYFLVLIYTISYITNLIKMVMKLSNHLYNIHFLFDWLSKEIVLSHKVKK